LGEDLLVGEPKEDSPSEETEHTRNEIIELAFAAPGGASARSVTGEGHAHTEYQTANQVADDVRGGHVGELDKSQAAQDV